MTTRIALCMWMALAVLFSATASLAQRLVAAPAGDCPPAAAERSFTYSLDDGTGETNIGNICTGMEGCFSPSCPSAVSIAWMNHFTRMAGAEVLTTIKIAWGGGFFLNGTSFTGYLWSDPNGDGDPSDAAVLASVPGTVANEGTDTFNDYALSSPALITTSQFFIGAIISYPNCTSPPARLDETPPSNMRSWVVTAPGYAPPDPNNLGAPNNYVRLTDNTLDPGNWMIRGVAEAAGSEEACCLQNACEMLIPSVCIQQQGTPQGPGSSCQPNPCIPPTGACCKPNGQCGEVPQNQCNGTYLGDNTSCNPNPCPQPTGACCTATGGCSTTTQAACQGAYLGDFSTCPETCVVPLINEVRIDQTLADNDEYFEIAWIPGASLAGLTYFVIGDGTAAQGGGVIEAVIPLTGYSIPADGHFLAVESLFTLAPAAQRDLVLGSSGLNFENGDNVTHLLVAGFTGAVGQDLDNNDCILDVQPWTTVIDKVAIIKENNPPATTECHYGPPTVGPFVPGHVFRLPDATGGWMIGPFDPAVGNDTPGTTNALQTGACCFDSSCTPAVSQSTCDSMGGVFQGTHSTCSPNPCIGACCVGGSCVGELSLSACLSASGVYRGGGTTCTGVGCPNTSTLVINEILADNYGTDTEEFIEIFSSTPNTNLAGLSLIIVDGDTAGSTTSSNYRRVNYRVDFGSSDVLDGGGFYLIASSTIPGADRTIPPSTIENGSQTYALVRTQDIATCVEDPSNPGFPVAGCSGIINSNRLTDGSVAAITAAINSAHQADSVAALDGTSGDHVYFSAPIAPYLFGYTQRIPNGIDTNTASDWQSSDGVLTPRGINMLATGACCNGAGCNVYTRQQCASAGGAYQGNGTTCIPANPCTGACCTGTSCNVLTYEQCISAGGVYQGPATTCSPANPCAGACCVGGSCIGELTRTACLSASGFYRGNGSTCAVVGCPSFANLVINEIWAEDPGTDDVEFVELFGTPGTSLGGLSLIVVDGDTDGNTASSNYRLVTYQANFGPSDVLDAAGFYLLGTRPGSEKPFSADTLQNGSQTYALVHTQDIVYDFSNGTPILTNGSAAAITAALAAHQVDAVATLDPSAGDHSYFGAPVVQDGIFAADYMQRIPNGVETDSPVDWETQFNLEFGAPGDASTPRGINTPGMGACCVGGACTADRTRAQCAALGGAYHGNGSVCTPNPCVGACCVGGVCTSDTTRSQCETTLSGSYFGDGTTCTAGLCDCKTIAQARALGPDQGVIICNVVVSSITDLNGGDTLKSFHAQDATGGITINGTNASIDALLASAGGIIPGKRIDLAGMTDSFSGLFELQDGSPLLKVLGVSGTPGIPTPASITTADLADGSATAESLESKLVKLGCVMFVDGDRGVFAGQTNYDVTDGLNTVTVRVSTNALNLVGQPIPFGPVALTGILSQADPTPPTDTPPDNTNYRLLLRSLADITTATCTGTTGACCSPAGSCTCALVQTGMCTAAGGIYRGDGVPCDPGRCPVLAGDINADGFVNLADVNPFVLVLLDTPASASHVPRCDLNCDGFRDGRDVRPFVGALIGP